MLHLVDFDNMTPKELKQQVTTAIEQANAFLDNLDKQDTDSQSNINIAAQTALADISHFDHINLALDRSWGVLSHLNSVMSNDDIRHTHHELLPLLSAYGTRVGQHKPLFERYQAIKKDTIFFNSLDTARQRATELALQRFELSGVALSNEQQQQFADIQSQLSTLSASFSDHVLDATQAFALPLTDNQLAGITDSGLALLAQAGEQYKAKLLESKQKTEADFKALPSPYYVATLDIPVYLAVMTHANDRSLRETLYKAYVTRASEFDAHTNKKGESLNNADIMQQILALRAQKAHLLGFDNYAKLSLSTKMADSPEQVESFLRDLADKARPFAQQDLAQLQAAAQKYGIDDIQPWDTAYLAEKVKQDKFQLSQEQIRPYFPLPKVIDGLFNIVNRLYGIHAVEYSDSVSRWHKDVRFYQLFDADDSLIGGFYFDLYARQGKRGGAWMSGFQPRYKYINSNTDNSIDAQTYQQLPVCFMVGNFTPATSDAEGNETQPSLLTHNEVLTLFHEFGHGLHHLLTQVTVGDVAGVNGVEWDAVELPSQFMENWAWDSEGIALISAHVDTGEPLPQQMLDALLAAKNFQSGIQTLRQIEFALFDLLIHSDTPAPDYQGILQTLDKVRDEIAIMPTPDYNRFANSFSHIFAGGYAAGYYSYKWAELLSADAFSKFEEEGIFNPQAGKAFREHILCVGGSLPAKTNFETFRGRPASIEALLRHSGFGQSPQEEMQSNKEV
ncbi:M3 family metallopeptidase [Psychrobacter sp. I-STPA10]|uniref:M3 family metallopeptidase n=1 Tax=Psychrobacter sp. I-STPA10 TaxID=2585769 RepID=UPI001E54386C|nr:M3 family metallopeptidase [Psychrobacter sp. I-STPA10]